MADYASELDVYEQSGYTSEMIQRVTEKSGTEVSNLINSFLNGSEKKIKTMLDIPHLVPRELHLGTGEDDEFQLGPEDECVYIDEDVEDLVDSIKHCYFGRNRRKRPYPKDCDEPTDDKDLWDAGAGYTQPTNENTIKKAGKYAMKFDWSGGAGKARYPDKTNNKYIQKNIDIYEFVFFRVQSEDTDGVTVTIRLYDDEDNVETATYFVSKKGKWYMGMLDIDEDFTGSIEWDDEKLYYFEIEVDKACTLILDNFCFNDKWAYTAPKGTLVIMHKSSDSPPADGFAFYVTYTYDPFKEEVPENIRDAVAQDAAIRLIDHLLGVRQAGIAFEYESDTLLSDSDKETLYARKTQLKREMKENLAAYGYGWTGTVARPYY